MQWQLTVPSLFLILLHIGTTNIQGLHAYRDDSARTMLEALRVDHRDHTFTDIGSYKTLHMSLNLTVDMTRETVHGYVEIMYVKIQLTNRGSHGIVMDHGLVLDVGDHITVSHVEDLLSGKNVSYQVYCRTPTVLDDPGVLNCALVLEQIMKTVGEGRVRIYYTTNSNSTALHFIQPSQTMENRTKFLVSQTQPSNARSWIPCQDTAAIKHPYDAEIRVATPYQVLMSATFQHVDQATKAGWNTYRFKQRYPVPPFLIAITVANIASVDLQHGDEEVDLEEVMTTRSVDEEDITEELCKNCATGDGDLTEIEEAEEEDRRTVPIRVWGEKDFIKKLQASGKLNMVPEMMKICQDELGKYPWDRYDIVLTPPGYVFQGMEYPGMNYISVTTLNLGDLAGPNYAFAEIIAHEMLHSWFGNLVTPKYASDAWLAEGITSFLGYTVLEQYYNNTELAMFLRREKFGNLKKVLASYEDWPSYKILTPDLYDEHPFLGFTFVIYNKGALFMEYLVHQTDTETVYNTLKLFLSRYRHQSVDTIDFLHVLFQSVSYWRLSEAAIFRWLERPATKIPLTLFQSYIFDECDIIYKVITNHPDKADITVQEIADAYKNLEYKWDVWNLNVTFSGNAQYIRRQMIIVLERMETFTSRIKKNSRNILRWSKLINKLDLLFGFSQLSKTDPDTYAVWASVALQYNHTATAAQAVDFIRKNGRAELLYKVITSPEDFRLRGQMAAVLQREHDLGSYPGFVGQQLQYYIAAFIQYNEAK